VADTGLKYASSSARPAIAAATGQAVMRTICTLLLLCSALAAPGAWAAEARTSMLVSATVVAHASLETVGSAVSVTEADLKRGYVDVSRTYRLRSNTPRTLLQLHPRVGLTRQIDVLGLASPLQISEASVEILQPARDLLQLQFRLWLQPDAVAGEYPLPVHLAALGI
jgi:hypothetical protein